MALFGDLAHHAFTDLAKVLRPQTGSLYLHEAYQGRTLELTLLQGQLLALYIDGFPVTVSNEATQVLQNVSTRRTGAFEFQKRPLNSNEQTLYVLPLLETLQNVPLADVPAERRPHPDTRFQSLAPAAVPGALQATWTDLAPHLRAGASATELSRATGRTIQDLQISLYHLRAAALIGPVRSAESLTHPTTQANGQAERQAGHMTDPAPAAQPTLTASAPIINRLLGALRRLTGARA